MNLETKRLRLRFWQPDQDAVAAFAIYGDKRVMEWIGDLIPDPSPAATQARLERYLQRTKAGQPPGIGIWAVERLETRHLVGTLLLVPLPDVARQPSGHIEIGWHFNPVYWGQGFATEAAQAVLRYGFETLKLTEIYAVTLPENVRSQAVAQRLGMADLGITQQYHGGIDLRLFQLTADDWRPKAGWVNPPQ
jgi:[ribosomal protein S5]-alanine N-acetyltransferase